MSIAIFLRRFFPCLTHVELTDGLMLVTEDEREIDAKMHLFCYNSTYECRPMLEELQSRDVDGKIMT